MARGRGKGGAFERELCRTLSLWWTQYDEEIRTDIFWRTAGSGGRAKTRSKRGQKTFGQYGDIQATDPIGQPLIDVLTIEAKKGYNKFGFFDFVESFGEKEKGWEKFVAQAREDSSNAGTDGWLLIWKRDSRKAVVWLPWNLYKDLPLSRAKPWLKIALKGKGRIFCTTLDEFLEQVKPDDIKALAPEPQKKILVIRKKRKGGKW
jgi:hypothetical protein